MSTVDLCIGLVEDNKEFYINTLNTYNYMLNKCNYKNNCI